uniref:Uncharacterized protein n=1 Tax=Anguilla anguilla TaxID=7936 RepID=A0A0E9VIT5_ANGAN
MTYKENGQVMYFLKTNSSSLLPETEHITFLMQKVQAARTLSMSLKLVI